MIWRWSASCLEDFEYKRPPSLSLVRAGWLPRDMLVRASGGRGVRKRRKRPATAHAPVSSAVPAFVPAPSKTHHRIDCAVTHTCVWLEGWKKDRGSLLQMIGQFSDALLLLICCLLETPRLHLGLNSMTERVCILFLYNYLPIPVQSVSSPKTPRLNATDKHLRTTPQDEPNIFSYASSTSRATSNKLTIRIW
jgi:hypothetical protein